MEVEITSKEMIKPSSPTPQHLKTYNLSLLDQLAPPLYIPIILFYSPASDDDAHHHLKKSFSETLTHFYPLAGRITQDEFSIDCNDEGATYIEANVVGEMSILLIQELDINQLEKLLPCNPYNTPQETTSQVILATQVNRFHCGGIAISVCIWHAIADASAVASFVTSWASIATTGSNMVNVDNGVIFDCTSLFPPQDVRSFSLRKLINKDSLRNIVVKRFVFDGSNIITLRKEVGNGPCLDYPTRVEAVASLIWAAVMTLTKHEIENEGNQSMEEINAAAISVNLRKRIIPTLPDLSIGNIFQVALANCSKNENNLLGYNGLAGKIRESIRKMNNEYVRKIHEGGAYFKFMNRKREEVEKNPNLMKVFGFSSWCRFPFYETDFGWGKPIWVGTALKLHNVAIFIDTKDGQGIEAWVALPKEDMVKFEQNSGICANASFKPST